jgi:hypothetical protein
LSRELEKRSFLIGELGADRFDFRELPPNRRAWLAQTDRQQTNQALSRMAPERRYPVLIAFYVEALERTTDDAVEIYDRALGGADRVAQRKREELERRGRRDTQATIRRFIDLTNIVLEAHDSGGGALRLIERRIGMLRLAASPPRRLAASPPRRLTAARLGARLAAARPPPSRLAPQPPRPGPAGIRAAREDERA